MGELLVSGRVSLNGSMGVFSSATERKKKEFQFARVFFGKFKSEPRKKGVPYFPLHWLFNKDPCNSLL